MMESNSFFKITSGAEAEHVSFVKIFAINRRAVLCRNGNIACK